MMKTIFSEKNMILVGLRIRFTDWMMLQKIMMENLCTALCKIYEFVKALNFPKFFFSFLTSTGTNWTLKDTFGQKGFCHGTVNAMYNQRSMCGMFLSTIKACKHVANSQHWLYDVLIINCVACIVAHSLKRSSQYYDTGFCPIALGARYPYWSLLLL
jgi:hypothetical protein